MSRADIEAVRKRLRTPRNERLPMTQKMRRQYREYVKRLGDASGWHGAGGGYQATATQFGGDTYLTRGADLTGNVDGKQGICSVWVDFKNAPFAREIVFDTSLGRFLIERTAAGLIVVSGIDATVTPVLNLSTVNTYSTGWINILSSWDLAVPGSSRLYISDVSDNNEITYVDAAISYTQANHGIAALINGNDKFDGCQSEIYINYKEYLDFNIAANRAKFISGGKPVSLGGNGELPTGNAPIVYYKDPNTSLVNLGTGGNFSVSEGELFPCVSSP